MLCSVYQIGADRTSSYSCFSLCTIYCFQSKSFNRLQIVYAYMIPAFLYVFVFMYSHVLFLWIPSYYSFEDGLKLVKLRGEAMQVIIAG